MPAAPVSTESRFLFTENVQFSYVSLRCTSSGQRTRSRHGRKAREEDGSSITAEFVLDVNPEEVTGWSLCASYLPAACILFLLQSLAAVCHSHINPNYSSISCFGCGGRLWVETFEWWLGIIFNSMFVINVRRNFCRHLWYGMLFSAESCDLNCVRRRSEKRLRKTIRTLRKSINREQFHLHFAGSDYELGKSLVQPAELPGHCVAGQVLVNRKCGTFGLIFFYPTSQ